MSERPKLKLKPGGATRDPRRKPVRAATAPHRAEAPEPARRGDERAPKRPARGAAPRRDDRPRDAGSGERSGERSGSGERPGQRPDGRRSGGSRPTAQGAPGDRAADRAADRTSDRAPHRAPDRRREPHRDERPRRDDRAADHPPRAKPGPRRDDVGSSRARPSDRPERAGRAGDDRRPPRGDAPRPGAPDRAHVSDRRDQRERPPARDTRRPAPHRDATPDRRPASSRGAPAPGRASPASRPARPGGSAVDRPRPDTRADAPSAPQGVRLSKRLTEDGVASRREADDWIDAGWVRVDGRVARLGQRVTPDQRIDIDPAARRAQAQRVTILLHKPLGYVSGQPEDGHEPASVLVRPENHWADDPTRVAFQGAHLRGLAPAGRLDIDSTGLLVLTQDGRVAKLLIGDDSAIEKEYLVRVEPLEGGTVAPDALERLRHGLELDGLALKPARVSWAHEDRLRFVLREGRKRQIRRMCELVGLKVVALKRIRIGRVALGALPPGQWRYLGEFERF